MGKILESQEEWGRAVWLGWDLTDMFLPSGDGALADQPDLLLTLAPMKENKYGLTTSISNCSGL